MILFSLFGGRTTDSSFPNSWQELRHFEIKTKVKIKISEDEAKIRSLEGLRLSRRHCL